MPPCRRFPCEPTCASSSPRSPECRLLSFGHVPNLSKLRIMSIVIAWLACSVNVCLPVRSCRRGTISSTRSVTEESLPSLPLGGFKILLIKLRFPGAEGGWDRCRACPKLPCRFPQACCNGRARPFSSASSCAQAARSSALPRRRSLLARLSACCCHASWPNPSDSSCMLGTARGGLFIADTRIRTQTRPRDPDTGTEARGHSSKGECRQAEM